jgi:pyrimidine-specific ribonucleoside hydrolase
MLGDWEEMMRRTIIALLLALAATVSLHAATKKKRVVISTDLATGLQGGWRQWDDADDGWAVAMALADPMLDPRGVITVFGNSNVAPETIVARELIPLTATPRVRIAMGASVKLDQPQAALNGKTLTRDCWSEGVAVLADVLKAAPATIVAIGPLTDVGCLALNEPALAAKITEVIAVMGRQKNETFSLGPIPALTDFNLVMDDRAVRVLLDETKIPMTFLQFDLTRQVLVPAEDVKKLATGTPLERFLYEGTMPWIGFWKNTFKEDGFHPWDSNAVFYASHPEAFGCETVHYEMVPCAAPQDDPYNRGGGCAGHGPNQNPSLDKEAFQLWLASDLTSARAVRTCTQYAPGGQDAFRKAIFKRLLPACGGALKRAATPDKLSW